MDSHDLTHKCRNGDLSFNSRVLLDLQHEIAASDRISFITSYKTNLYIGTTHGKLLHYYQFEDADDYIMISQFDIASEPTPIRKLLVLPVLQRLLVLCGTTATMYSLPELSPLHIGKLKDINDVLLLSYSSQADSSRVTAVDDKIVIFTPSKIRIVSVKQDQLKLSKDINYSSAIKGVSTSSNMTTNFSNLVLVANKTTYDIVDMQLTRKIPLFEFDQSKSERSISPFIVPYKAMDQNGDEEYMLTIKSDETTSIVMFINCLGDVTRGTISFIDKGYPETGVITNWPYVFGIFRANGVNKILVSSLKSLETEAEFDLGYFLGMSNLEAPKAEALQPELSETTLEAVESEANPMTSDIEAPKVEESLNATEVTVDDVSSTVQIGNENEAETKASKVSDTEEALTEFKLSSVSSINFTDANLVKVLSKVNIETGETIASDIEKSISNILIHNNSKVWLVYGEKEVLRYLEEFQKSLSNGNFDALIVDLKGKVDSYKDVIQDYLLHMLILMLVYLQQFESALSYALRFSKGSLQFDTKILLSMLSNASIGNLQVYSSFLPILSNPKYKDKECQDFLMLYLGKVYPDLLSEEDRDSVRRLFYENFQSCSQVIDFIEGKDTGMWNSLQANKHIIQIMEGKKQYLAQLHAYGRLLDAKVEDPGLSLLFCDLGIQLLSGELHDSEFEEKDNSKLVDQLLFQMLDNNFDKETYAKFLLGILKIDQNKGFQFMISNKKHKYNDTHKKIMNEIPQAQANDLAFTLLRIEYFESSFMESQDPDKSRHLLLELIKVLTSEAVLSESNIINFQILSETYKIENCLTNSKWPKISWIEYLHTNMRRSEARDFIKLYLKTYELLLFFHYQGLSHDFASQISEIPVLSYLMLITSKNPVPELLGLADFSTAEYYSIHRCMPFLSSPFYFKTIPSANFPDDANATKESLLQVFRYYVDEAKEDYVKLFAIRHFLQAYGDSIFTPIETLKLLPDYVPIIYINEFLNEVMIDINNTVKEVSLRKALNKADAKFTQTIYNDLNDA